MYWSQVSGSTYDWKNEKKNSEMNSHMKRKHITDSYLPLSIWPFSSPSAPFPINHTPTGKEKRVCSLEFGWLIYSQMMIGRLYYS